MGGVDDYGLCQFACSRGYCPDGAYTSKAANSGGGGDTPVYIDPTIWTEPTPIVSYIPPCVVDRSKSQQSSYEFVTLD